MFIVRYTERWVSGRRHPFPGTDYLSEEQARARFAAGESMDVLDATRLTDEGHPFPRWDIGQIHGQFRVAWHNEVGSQVQESDYLLVDGRLFLARVSEYGYPDDETEYDRLDASTVTTARFKPDGTGTLELTDESDRTEVTYFKDIPDMHEHWMDPPTFGEWTALIDRDYRASRYR